MDQEKKTVFNIYDNGNIEVQGDFSADDLDFFRLPIKFYRPDKNLNAFFTKDAEGNVGWDMISTQSVGIQPGEILKVPVNLQVAIPKGFYGRIVPRSGLSSQGINIIPGTIDSNFTGQIHAIVQNFSHDVFMIERGMRIAQLIVMQHEIPKWEEVENPKDLGETSRGDKGFGSSGLY